MKKVCIVQGGPFLLGIDGENVIARRTWAETAAQAEQEGTVFQLDALLSRQPAQTVPDKAVCLELRNGQERVFLVADRIAADEVEIINPPGPLPSACPALTARLCPQVTIWDEQPILLLEPTQLFATAAELGENIGVLLRAEETIDDQPAAQQKTEPALDDDPFFPEIEEEDASSEPPPTLPFFLENALAESAAPDKEEEPEQPLTVQEAQKRESAAIDEETFKQVMSWTIARFKQSGRGQELHLGVEDMPPALAGMIKRKGLNRNVIEYLMEQIVLRCKETMSRKKQGGNDAG
jgi:hypothetical protein